MDSNYTRIFIGGQIEALALTARLKEIGINAVVKDEDESARLAGFGSPSTSNTQVFVHHDELAQAQSVMN
jgi:hypothetical protein